MTKMNICTALTDVVTLLEKARRESNETGKNTTILLAEKKIQFLQDRLFEDSKNEMLEKIQNKND